MKDKCEHQENESSKTNARLRSSFLFSRSKMRRLGSMKRSCLFVIVAVLVAVPAAAQHDKPEFSDYPAKIEKKRSTAIDFRNSPGASAFRTRLRSAIRGNVNFAGRYIIAGWGCGTGCVSGAVIDTRNGRVYFPKELSAVAVSFAETGYEEPLTFLHDSRLLVISGILGTEPDDDENLEEGTRYLEWVNNRFRLIKFVPAKQP
jgi:hypothetical protein